MHDFYLKIVFNKILTIIVFSVDYTNIVQKYLIDLLDNSVRRVLEHLANGYRFSKNRTQQQRIL